jgi:hypothetical protein
MKNFYSKSGMDYFSFFNCKRATIMESGRKSFFSKGTALLQVDRVLGTYPGNISTSADNLIDTTQTTHSLCN